MKQIDYFYDRKFVLRKCWCYFFVIFLSFGFFVYSVIKGVFIYKVRLQKEYKFYLIYFVLVISVVVFFFLEIVFVFSSFVVMRRLKLLRIFYIFNDIEVKRKLKVNLGRLMILVKLVSVLVDFVNIFF